jgi:hypothetical protein
MQSSFFLEKQKSKYKRAAAENAAAALLLSGCPMVF